MLFKRFSYVLIGILSVGVVLVAFTPQRNATFSWPFKATGSLHSLTGLPGVDSEVVVVKIDDTVFAHPQVGLKAADIVYIEQVEGGLTRLAAVFSSSKPSLVGPIRSARISDIDLLAQFGRVGFAYSGAQSKFLPVLAAANVYDVGAMHYGAKFYINDPARTAPYAMMLKLPELISSAKSKGVQFEKSRNIGFAFGKTNVAGSKFSAVRILWPASSYSAQWSDEEKRFLLFHVGAPDYDEGGYQLGPKNILIQIVDISNSIYHDKVGGVTPLIQTIGQGSCYLLRDGVAIPCLWSRADAESGTILTSRNGEELTLSPGQTWVALTSREPVFEGIAVDSQETSTSK